jgi:hypothetical protein
MGANTGMGKGMGKGAGGYGAGAGQYGSYGRSPSQTISYSSSVQ